MILQTLEDLERDLKTFGLRSVYAILGPEQYLCRQAVCLIKSQALAPDAGAFDFSEFRAGEDSINDILETANTYPMMSKKRVALVSAAERLSDSDQETFLAALPAVSTRGLIILLADEFDRRKKFYKTIRETACVAEFSSLKGAALERWADAYVRREGCQISPSALKNVLDLAGSDLQSLSTELAKLILFSGKEKNIPDSAIEELVRSSRQHKIFELLDAIGVRDRKGALRMLDSLLASGEAPIGIVAMMARHCRQVLIARDFLSQRMDAREIASKLQVLPFLADKFMRQVRSADPSAIREMYIRLAETDRRLKSSSGDGRTLLEQAICLFV